MHSEFMEIDTDSIIVKIRLRKNYGDLGMLENSIRKLGILCPLIVDRDNVLISGERRLQACRNLGIIRVPVLKLNIQFNSMTALDIQSDLNICREPLSNEELEEHIKMKKDAMAGKFFGQPTGIFARLKRWFSMKLKTEQVTGKNSALTF